MWTVAVFAWVQRTPSEFQMVADRAQVYLAGREHHVVDLKPQLLRQLEESPSRPTSRLRLGCGAEDIFACLLWAVFGVVAEAVLIVLGGLVVGRSISRSGVVEWCRRLVGRCRRAAFIFLVGAEGGVCQ